MRIPIVVSYDPKKVFLLGKRVIKVTDAYELSNLSHFMELIRNQKIFLEDFGYFNIRVPNVESFDDSNLRIEFLCGDNFEVLLRNENFNSNNRKRLFKIIVSLFNWFYNNSLVWHDFAPRNVIINFEKKVINLVDFERGFVIMDGKIDRAEYCYYLSSIIVEEWGAFLTIEEFNYLLPNFWECAEEINDKLDILTSKRKAAIFRLLYPDQSVTTKKVIKISRVMQELAQAKNNNGLLNFPLIKIERMTKELGVDYYAQFVLRYIKHKGDH